VLRFNALKRLYRLLIQYFSDVLNQNTSALEVPDLQVMAKDHSVKDTLVMCRLTISIAVQCENNEHIIGKIQSLSDTSQHYLMKAIEQVCGRNRPMYLRYSPPVDYGQSSGFWRHPRHIDNDRVRMSQSSIASSGLISPFH